MSYRGVSHVIFNLHLGVGHSVLLQLEGVGHVFSNQCISKCSGPPPPPVLFDQSLMNKKNKQIRSYFKSQWKKSACVQVLV